MLIYIAGVCHQDPKGKANLHAWLRSLSAGSEGPPAFVGVEYDENKFAELKKQRPMLWKELESFCPRAASDLLDALADCLAYEADAVAKVFPDVEPLWLEEGTPDPTDNIYEVWVATYKRYKSSVDSKRRPFPAKSQEALALLSEAAWEDFERQSPQASEPRDAKFACLVLEKILKVSGG